MDLQLCYQWLLEMAAILLLINKLVWHSHKFLLRLHLTLYLCLSLANITYLDSLIHHDSNFQKIIPYLVFFHGDFEILIMTLFPQKLVILNF